MVGVGVRVAVTRHVCADNICLANTIVDERTAQVYVVERSTAFGTEVFVVAVVIVIIFSIVVDGGIIRAFAVVIIQQAAAVFDAAIVVVHEILLLQLL